MNKFRIALNGLIAAYPHIEDDVNEIYRQYQQGLITHSDMTLKLLDLPMRAWSVVDIRPEIPDLFSQLLQSNPYRDFDTLTVYQIDSLKVGRIDEDGVYVINPPIRRFTKNGYRCKYRAIRIGGWYHVISRLIADVIVAAGCDNVRFAGKDLVNATRDYNMLVTLIEDILRDLDDKFRKINDRAYARAKARQE